MSPDPTSHFEDPAAAQQRFLSLFLRSDGEFFRYVAALVADAEDIVQQTALVLWEKFDAYDAGQPFTPWACQLALNNRVVGMVRVAMLSRVVNEHEH